MAPPRCETSPLSSWKYRVEISESWVEHCCRSAQFWQVFVWFCMIWSMMSQNSKSLFGWKGTSQWIHQKREWSPNPATDLDFRGQTVSCVAVISKDGHPKCWHQNTEIWVGTPYPTSWFSWPGRTISKFSKPNSYTSIVLASQVPLRYTMPDVWLTALTLKNLHVYHIPNPITMFLASFAITTVLACCLFVPSCLFLRSESAWVEDKSLGMIGQPLCGRGLTMIFQKPTTIFDNNIYWRSTESIEGLLCICRFPES